MTKHIANILTGYRIFGSILLLFCHVSSLEFYIIYILCGFSDMIDGTIARKTNSTSKFGSQLDSIADFIFAGISFLKLLPTIHIPGWLWIWGGMIAVIKIGNIIWRCISKKNFSIFAYDYEQSNRTGSVPMAFDDILCGIGAHCHNCMFCCYDFCNSGRSLCYNG